MSRHYKPKRGENFLPTQVQGEEYYILVRQADGKEGQMLAYVLHEALDIVYDVANADFMVGGTIDIIHNKLVIASYRVS